MFWAAGANPGGFTAHTITVKGTVQIDVRLTLPRWVAMLGAATPFATIIAVMAALIDEQPETVELLEEHALGHVGEECLWN